MKSVVLPAVCAALGLADLAWIDFQLAPAAVAAASPAAATTAPVVATTAPVAVPARPLVTTPAETAAIIEPAAPKLVVAAATAAPVAQPAIAAAASPAAAAPPANDEPIVVYFDVDARDPKGEIDVQKIAAQMATKPVLRASVEGHTDRTGAPSHNEQLSRARAQAVAEALVARGVDPSRIVLRAHGARAPAAAGDDADSLARNRRVEVRLAEGAESANPKPARKPVERRPR